MCPEILIDNQATGPIFMGPSKLHSVLVYLRAIDPEFTTTERCGNLVNDVWIPRHSTRHLVALKVEQDPVPLTLGEVLVDLREKIDLPVSDLAPLCGVERRQFYNLLHDRTTTARTREEAVRALHQTVDRIDALLHGDKTKVRAAMLLPTGPEGETLYSVACTQSVPDVRRVGNELIERLEGGRVGGMIPRPSPSLSRFSDGSHAIDFLRVQSSEAKTDP
jgi:hypothetical protein